MLPNWGPLLPPPLLLPRCSFPTAMLLHPPHPLKLHLALTLPYAPPLGLLPQPPGQLLLLLLLWHGQPWRRLLPPSCCSCCVLLRLWRSLPLSQGLQGS